MPNTNLQQNANEYAHALPEYGGMYRDGDTLVVLFTGHLAEHDRVLQSFADRPLDVRVGPADRSWKDVVAGRSRVEELVADPKRWGVTAVGTTVRDGQFVTSIGISPFDSQAARDLQNLVEPEPVVIDERAPARLLSRSG